MTQAQSVAIESSQINSSGVLQVAGGGTGTTTSTGTGALVLNSSPTFIGTTVIPTINSGTSTALTLQSNGTTAITVDTSQNVGIGTSSPVSGANLTTLTVYNATQPALYLQNSTTGTTATDGLSIGMSGTDCYFNNRESGNIITYVNGSERMRITSAGNVGIGSTAPSGKLTVAEATNDARIYLIATNTSRAALIDLQGTISGYNWLNSTNNGTLDWRIGGGAGANILTFCTGSAGTEAMRIDGSQNVGANITPWTGISNAFNYQTGVQRVIASGNMTAGTWANTSLVLTASNGFVFAELVATGNENGRNNGIRVYNIVWNTYDGWAVSLKYNTQEGNDYGQVDVQMNGSTVQVKAVNNSSGGNYRLYLTYYLS